LASGGNGGCGLAKPGSGGGLAPGESGGGAVQLHSAPAPDAHPPRARPAADYRKKMLNCRELESCVDTSKSPTPLSASIPFHSSLPRVRGRPIPLSIEAFVVACVRSRPTCGCRVVFVQIACHLAGHPLFGGFTRGK
jgi:hypothetical protein